MEKSTRRHDSPRSRILRQTWLAATCCLMIANSASGVDFNQSTGDLLYNDGAGHTLPYRLFLPAGYDPGLHYPLVIFFHGAGERGTNNTAPSTGGGHMENLYQATQGAFSSQFKALLLVPQCPTTDQWVNWPWANGSYTQAQEPAEGQSMHSALAILDQVIATYPVDSHRVYVTGLSMGGFGTWNAIRLRPRQFAAAMPLSGGGNKDQGALLKNIPIWAYHGITDTTVPVSGTDQMRDAIQTAGTTIEYTRINTGHSGWSTFYDNTTYNNSANQKVFEWLFSQTLAASDHSTVVATPNSTPADGTTISTITVTLLDGGDIPVPGKTVTLSSNRGAVDVISAASGPSDSSGSVTFSVRSSVAGIATFTATNTTDGLVLRSKASVTYTSTVPPVPTVVFTKEFHSSVMPFTTVPNLSGIDHADANSGNGATVTNVAGNIHTGVASGTPAPLLRLLDGAGVTSPGILTQVFAFADSTVTARLKMDLQSTIPIAEVNSYSTHEGTQRGDQNYTLFGSNSNLAGTGDPASEGWTLIAVVSTSYKASGIVGVSVHSSSPGASIGGFRYLLFAVRASSGTQSTEYYEIDVVATDYGSWAGDFPNLSASDGGADPDGDGMTNDAEYAFGLNPTLGSSVNPITSPLNWNNGGFTYTRRDPSLTSLTYAVLVSTDLLVWRDALDPVISNGTPDPVSHVQTVTVGVRETPVDGRLFVRVRAR